MKHKQLYLIAYDIHDDKKRTRLASKLEDLGGQRINYSVFELMLPPRHYPAFEQEMQDLTEAEEDRIAIYPVCRSCYSRAAWLPEKGPLPPTPLVSV